MPGCGYYLKPSSLSSLKHGEGGAGAGVIPPHVTDADVAAQKEPGSLSPRSVSSRVWIQTV